MRHPITFASECLTTLPDRQTTRLDCQTASPDCQTGRRAVYCSKVVQLFVSPGRVAKLVAAAPLTLGLRLVSQEAVWGPPMERGRAATLSVQLPRAHWIGPLT